MYETKDNNDLINYHSSRLCNFFFLKPHNTLLGQPYLPPTKINSGKKTQLSKRQVHFENLSSHSKGVLSTVGNVQEAIFIFMFLIDSTHR